MRTFACLFAMLCYDAVFPEIKVDATILVIFLGVAFAQDFKELFK
jgi:hypothetical protein